MVTTILIKLQNIWKNLMRTNYDIPPRPIIYDIPHAYIEYEIELIKFYRYRIISINKLLEDIDVYDNINNKEELL